MSAASDLLRRAAKVLREHAEAAPHGPWSWMGGYPQQVTNGAATLIADIFENPDVRSTIAEYIALMDPTVGLALADWLDSESRIGPSPNAVAVARAVLREGERHDDS